MRKQRGAVLLEAVAGLLLLTFVVLGGFDLSMAASAKNSVQYLAQQATVCVEANNGCDPTTFANASAQGVGLNPNYLTVTTNGSGHGESITVAYVYHAFGPAFPVTLNLVAIATVP